MFQRSPAPGEPDFGRVAMKGDAKVIQYLNTVLGSAGSYGFSFVNFGGEVTGKLSMGSFEIR